MGILAMAAGDIFTILIVLFVAFIIVPLMFGGGEDCHIGDEHHGER